ncbi:hypothetical protein D3C87_1233230 [compost metagenome]
MRAAGIAIQPCRHLIAAHGGLVDVHDLGFAKAHRGFAGNEACRKISSVLRIGAEHGGIHLHTCRDTEDRHAITDHFQHIARGAIAAGEQKQIDRGIRHDERDISGVIGPARPRRRRIDDNRVETGGARDIFAQLTRAGDQPKWRRRSGQAFERDQGPIA